MSGSSLDYSFEKIHYAADILREHEDPLFRQLAAHLSKVSRALHDVEWYLSGDSDLKSAHDSINKVLSVVPIRIGYSEKWE